MYVFVLTWFLHSYQWFWLRGGFPMTPQDVFFWGILGALVVTGWDGQFVVVQVFAGDDGVAVRRDGLELFLASDRPGP